MTDTAMRMTWKRLGVEALCFMMILHGGPLYALQQADAKPSVAQEEKESQEPSRAAALWQAAGEELGDAGQAVRDGAETLTAQPWGEALSVLFGDDEAAPARFLTESDDPRFDAVPPLPPGFEEKAAGAFRPAGFPGVRRSPQTLAETKNHLDAIPVLGGWNMLSIPEEPADPAPSAVLGSVAGSFERVFAYDACDTVDPWKLYDPDDASASDLLDLDPTKGWWIDATGPVSLPSDGTLAPSTSWQLCTGWNLIGYPAGEPRHIRNALQSIEGKYIRAFGFDPADPEDPWEIWDIAVPDWANDLMYLRPGFGYWILVTEDVSLEIANEAGPPVVALTSPVDLSEITAPTEIRGTVQSKILDHWTLTYRMIGDPDWIELGRGDFPVQDEPLATFDPTLLLNGMYEIRLEGVDIDGMVVDTSIAVVVDGNMKIGNFTLSFVDFRIPLSGLDLEILRTYDTRERYRQGDFGQGWTLDIRQGSYTNNRPPGDGWEIVNPGGPLGLPCEQTNETKSHLTTIRLSDREVYRFRLTLVDPAAVIGGCVATTAFEFVDGPLPGSTLEIPGNPQVIYRNESGNLIHFDTLELFIPEQVKLTTRDGRVFYLNISDGVTRLEDTNGNALDITPSGITHSSGKGVEFLRDGAGRITEIVDTAGTRNVYVYDENGDLTVHTDVAGAETRFRYQDHYLEDMENALGVRALRTEYDEEGRIVRLIDADGRETSFAHDLDARRDVVTNRLGFSRIMEYDDRGNVIKEINENGETSLSTYDSRGRLLTETDALGHVTAYTYTGLDDMATVKGPNGNTLTFTYQSQGRPNEVVDALGRRTQATYDADGNVTAIIDALGQSTNFDISSKGDVVSVETVLGHKSFMAYDGDGNLIEETNPEGEKTTHTYDSAGNIVSTSKERTLPDGSLETLTTRFFRDEFGRVVRTVDPTGAESHTSYDLLGDIVAETDAEGRTTRYEYNPQGLLTKKIYPDGLYTETVYDAEGNEIASIDKLGRRTLYTYDPAGRLIRTQYPGPDAQTVVRRYDAAGHLAELVDETGQTTRYTRDPFGRVIKIEDANGSETAFAYDDMGQLLSTTDARGHITKHEYDLLGRRLRTIFPDGSTQESVYDALGHEIRTTDEEGRVTEMAYDSLSRLTSVKDALGHVTSYTYDELGYLAGQTDALGRETRYVRDGIGRLMSRILPDGAAESFSYFDDGQVKTHANALGQTTTYAYDVEGRLTERRGFDGSTHRFNYNAVGERVWAEDPSGRRTTYTRDLRDRLVAITDGHGDSLSFQYDAAGRQITKEVELDQQSYRLDYTYDGLDRVTSIVAPGGERFDLSYTADGMPASLTRPNGETTTWTYDSRGRLENLEVRDGGGVVGYGLTYAYFKTGHVQQITDHDGNAQTFEYDALWRLTKDTLVTGTGDLVYEESFVYDAVGNRISATLETGDPADTSVTSFEYDTRDRIVKMNDLAWSWDAAGRLLQRPGEAGGDDLSLSWGFENRLSQMVGSSGRKTETGYDADGRRVETADTAADGTVSNLTHLWDPSEELGYAIGEKVDGDHRVYLRAGDLLLGSLTNGSVSEHYDVDKLGSVRRVADGAGTELSKPSYSAFGRPLSSSPAGSIGFAGEPSSMFGFGYHRERWMDPVAGRFISPDPIYGWKGDPLSQHPFMYARSAPTTLTDSTGLFFSGGIVGLAITGLIQGALRLRAAIFAFPAIQAARVAAVSLAVVSLMSTVVPYAAKRGKKKKQNKKGKAAVPQTQPDLDPENPDHRGRVQFQGGDLRRRFGDGTPPKLQFPWADHVPPSRFQGLAYLLTGWSRLNKHEKARRTTAFEQVKRWVFKGPHHPPGKSFSYGPEAGNFADTPRIDIEIDKGWAFAW